MATHYSANQYENAFAANHLQNYQVPSKYKEHPTARVGYTKVITNDRGHLLQGVHRSTESPWGNFKGTWDYEMDCKQTHHHKTAKKRIMQKSNQPLQLQQKQRSVTPEGRKTSSLTPDRMRQSPKPEQMRQSACAKTPSPVSSRVQTPEEEERVVSVYTQS